MELILDYDWPGNIRELQERHGARGAAARTETIEPEHLPHEKMTLPAPCTGSPVGDEGQEDERKRILAALDQCAGNQTRAAKVLGIGRRTLTSKLTRFGIRRPRKKE